MGSFCCDLCESFTYLYSPEYHVREHYKLKQHSHRCRALSKRKRWRCHSRLAVGPTARYRIYILFPPPPHSQSPDAFFDACQSGDLDQVRRELQEPTARRLSIKINRKHEQKVSSNNTTKH